VLCSGNCFLCIDISTIVVFGIWLQAGSVMRLPKFEVDLPAASKAQKTGLLERDVTLANM